MLMYSFTFPENLEYIEAMFLWLVIEHDMCTWDTGKIKNELATL